MGQMVVDMSTAPPRLMQELVPAFQGQGRRLRRCAGRSHAACSGARSRDAEGRLSTHVPRQSSRPGAKVVLMRGKICFHVQGALKPPTTHSQLLEMLKGDGKELLGLLRC
jgi:hypothetical protein